MTDLDRLVHERVMGRCVHDWRLAYADCCRSLHKCKTCGATSPVAAEPNPCSADIAEAFRVVEKLRGEGWRLKLWESTHPDCPVQWSAEFERGGASELEHGQTPAEAIARAALATTEGK